MTQRTKLMIRLIIFVAGIILGLILLAKHAHAQNAGDTTLTGKWDFRLGTNLPNRMELTDDKSLVTGTYARTIKEVCPVTGTDNNGIINLKVICADKYHFTLEGIESLTDQTAHGTYLVNGRVSGNFTMERVTCFLPEGCKN
jgi:hypothetical protein